MKEPVRPKPSDPRDTASADSGNAASPGTAPSSVAVKDYAAAEQAYWQAVVASNSHLQQRSADAYAIWTERVRQIQAQARTGAVEAYRSMAARNLDVSWDRVVENYGIWTELLRKATAPQAPSQELVDAYQKLQQRDASFGYQDYLAALQREAQRWTDLRKQIEQAYVALALSWQEAMDKVREQDQASYEALTGQQQEGLRRTMEPAAQASDDCRRELAQAYAEAQKAASAAYLDLLRAAQGYAEDYLGQLQAGREPSAASRAPEPPAEDRS